MTRSRRSRRETPHKFTNIGEGRLRMLCIHASPRIIQYELEE